MKNLCEALEQTASRVPARGFRFIPESGLAGESSETFVSFAALEKATARWGGALQSQGLEKGDRVVLVVPKNEDFVLAFLGAIRAGIVPVPIYPPLGLGKLQGYLDNTRHIVEKSGARAILTDNKIKSLLGTVQAKTRIERVLTLDQIEASKEPLKSVDLGPDDTAFLQFTSGSTSQPKGVRLTHGNLLANVKCIMHHGLRSHEGDVGVSWLPLYHDMGLIGFVLAPMVYEVPVVFLPPLLFLKRPLTWLQAITRHRGTISYAPNFAFALCKKRIRERDLEGIDLSTWRIAGCGAEPIRAETLEAFAETFAGVGFRKEALLPSYGMAESSLAISFTELEEGMKTISVDVEPLLSEGRVVLKEDGLRLVSCGSAFPEHEIAIFDGNDRLPEDRVGEIRVRGPSVMREYFQDEEKTRDTFHEGWLKTGDLGFLHANKLYVCGRTKEVIIVNGRNYYPQDIEWEASRADGVRKGNVIAFGVRAEDRERLVVVYETDRIGDAETIAKQIRELVQVGTGLALDDVVAVASGVLPKTSSGKLQRTLTRDLYASGDLSKRTSARDVDKIEIVKQAALSQLSYLKDAVFGGKRRAKNGS